MPETAVRICTEEGCERPHLARDYCSLHYKRHYPSKPHSGKARSATCKVCGQGFTRVTKNPDRMNVCGESCRRWWIGYTSEHKTCEVPWAQCPECTRPFVKHNGRIYCTDQCADEASARKNGSRNRTCRQCGQELGYYCVTTYCEPCREARARQSQRENSANGKHRRRAWIKQAPHEPISRVTIYRRDNWTCGICQQHVDGWLTYPHPMSASLDHVIPLARGGSHTYRNVQLAHLRCNIAKGDRLREQMGDTSLVTA